MSAGAWPPDGPLTRWMLGELEQVGDEVAEEMREELDDIEVVRLMHEDEGMCLYGIARELGISTEEARRRLIVAGVPQRRWR